MLLDARILRLAHERNGGLDVVVGAPELDVRPEQRPEGTPALAVRKPDAARPDEPDAVDLALVLQVDVSP